MLKVPQLVAQRQGWEGGQGALRSGLRGRAVRSQPQSIPGEYTERVQTNPSFFKDIWFFSILII